MKPPREFGPLPHVRYRPELPACPHCGAPLRLSHPVWAKPIQSLAGPAHVTNLGFRCTSPVCPFPRTVYRSARAEARQVKGSGYGLDVVAHIGALRFRQHRTREEIWRHLAHDTSVQISERHVQNLLEIYLALLRASQGDLAARLAATVEEHGGLILALDGLQPEQGNEQLWVVREVQSGAVLGASNLQQASAPFLEPLLSPIRDTGLPVLGVVSDAQESIRVAVARVFPGVPHQLCQYHALREAAEPLWEADRHLLVEAKMELRGLRKVEERTRQPGAPDPPDPASPGRQTRPIRPARWCSIRSWRCGRRSASAGSCPSISPGCGRWRRSATSGRRSTAACGQGGSAAGATPDADRPGRGPLRRPGDRPPPGARLAARDRPPAGTVPA